MDYLDAPIKSEHDKNPTVGAKTPTPSQSETAPTIPPNA